MGRKANYTLCFSRDTFETGRIPTPAALYFHGEAKLKLLVKDIKSAKAAPKRGTKNP